MPIPQTVRVNPLDLQGNIAIGVSLPFGQSDVSSYDYVASGSITGPRVFKSTYSTADQIKSNLINLLLTNKGERLFNPEFGADLKLALFEQINDSTLATIRNLITTNVNMFIPEITVSNINIAVEEESNKISIVIQYKINLSGTADQITVEFI